MVRRYAVIALVALVLIPSVALADGFAGGFGPKSSPLGPKIDSPGAPDWAENATAPRWNGTGAGTGDRVCDSVRDRVQLRDGICLTARAGDRAQNRTQLRNITDLPGPTCDRDCTRLQDGASPDDRATPPAGSRRFAQLGRHHRALGR